MKNHNKLNLSFLLQLTKVKLVVFFTLFTFTTLAQDIKSIKEEKYNFTDDIRGSDGGTAEYQYYLNGEQKKIMHGTFKYFLRGRDSDASFEVTGQYDNNKKVGTWKYVYTIYALNINAQKKTTWYGQDYIQVSATTSNKAEQIKTDEFNYTNGKISGNYKYSLLEKDNGKWFNSALIELSINNENKTFIGPFKYKSYVIDDNLQGYPFTVLGQYNEMGAPNGKWIVTGFFDKSRNKIVNVEYDYNQGLLISEKVKDPKTGELFVNYNRVEKQINDASIKSTIVYYKILKDQKGDGHQVFDPNSPVFAFEDPNRTKTKSYLSDYAVNDGLPTLSVYKTLDDLSPSLPAEAPMSYIFNNYASLIGKKVFYKEVKKADRDVLNNTNLSQEVLGVLLSKYTPNEVKIWDVSLTELSKKLFKNPPIMLIFEQAQAPFLQAEKYKFINNTNGFLTKETKAPSEWAYPYVTLTGEIGFNISTPLIDNSQKEKYMCFASTEPENIITFFNEIPNIKISFSYINEKSLKMLDNVLSIKEKLYQKPKNTNNNPNNSSFTPPSAPSTIKNTNILLTMKNDYRVKDFYLRTTIFNSQMKEACKKLNLAEEDFVFSPTKIIELEKNLIEGGLEKLGKLTFKDTLLFSKTLTEFNDEIEKLHNCLEKNITENFCKMPEKMFKMDEKYDYESIYARLYINMFYASNLKKVNQSTSIIEFCESLNEFQALYERNTKFNSSKLEKTSGELYLFGPSIYRLKIANVNPRIAPSIVDNYNGFFEGQIPIRYSFESMSSTDLIKKEFTAVNKPYIDTVFVLGASDRAKNKIKELKDHTLLVGSAVKFVKDSILPLQKELVYLFDVYCKYVMDGAQYNFNMCEIESIGKQEDVYRAWIAICKEISLEIASNINNSDELRKTKLKLQKIYAAGLNVKAFATKEESKKINKKIKKGSPSENLEFFLNPNVEN